jgi:hypothetical protein
MWIKLEKKIDLINKFDISELLIDIIWIFLKISNNILENRVIDKAIKKEEVKHRYRK